MANNTTRDQGKRARGMRTGWLRRGLAMLVLSACASVICASGHEYYFTQIGGKSAGLAQNAVHVLFQDRHGFIWIGTEGGLNRFDGYTLQRHLHDPDRADSLPAGLITALADADKGNLWVGMQSGLLLRYDPYHHRVVQQIGQTGGGMISTLFRDAGGRVWTADAAGISVLEPGQDTLKRVYTTTRREHDFYTTTINGFSQCPDGQLYASGDVGLLSISDGSAKVLGHAGPLRGVFCDRRNRLFAASPKRLLRVNRVNGVLASLWQVPEPGDANIWQLTEDHDGVLWAAVRDLGLVKMETDGSHLRLLKPAPDQPDSLPSVRLTRLMVDRSGLVWVGTGDRGAVHTLAQGSAVDRLINRNPDLDSTAANVVRSIFQDSQDRYWIGTRGAGLQQFIPGARDFVDTGSQALRDALGLPRHSAVSIHAIAAAAAGSLWLATDHGVLLYDPANDSARRLDLGKPKGSEDRYRDILVDSDGSLWLAGLDSALVHYRAGRGVIGRYSTSNGLGDDFVFALARGKKGRLWVGMLHGLSVFDPINKRFRTFVEEPGRHDSLAGSRVTDLRKDSHGDLWIATDAGINKLLDVDAQGLHVRRILHRDGLPDSMAYCVLDDSRGHMWVSSNLGVSRVDLGNGSVRTLSPSDGLQGLEFNTGACLRDRQGNLWFGGVHGLNRLDPNDLKTSSFMPPTVITKVQYGDHTVSRNGARSLRIPQQAHVVRFSFASLDFARPSANRFRYRMIGVDRQWLDNGTNSRVTYTNLHPGRYQFEVSGSNRDGVFNPNPDILQLEILPPWWNTVAARIAAALLLTLILALLLGMWLRRRQLEKRHQQQLREYDDRLRLALWGSGDQFWDFDLVNERVHRIDADRLTGGEAEQHISLQKWRTEHVHPDDIGGLERRALAHIEGRTDRFESEHRVLHSSGQWRWVRSRGQVVERDARGKPTRMAGTIHSLDRQRAEEHQRRIAASVIHSMAEAVCVTDLNFRFVSINPAFTRIVGYSQAEVQGKDANILNCNQHSPAMYRQMRDKVHQEGHWKGEMWQRRKDGEEFLSWIEVNAVKSTDGERSHYVQVMSDITERKRSEQELRYLANYDTLSGLPNRTLLSQRLDQAIRMADRVNHKVAVLFIDLDRFKQVNDSMGHTVGDRMLKAAGARLRAHVRQTDIVARLGGDEFSVVLENIQGHDEAVRVARELIAAFEKPLKLDTGQELATSPSIGIALYPEHASTPDDLLKYADTAMYKAKSAGRNTWALYTATLEAQARQHASLLTALRQALANDELSVVYQPKLDIGSWQITGVEALLRWHSRHLGQVPPSTFIPLAEEAGLISEIGRFVLHEACAVLAQWRAHDVTDVTMAVNISSAQLLSHKLEEHINQALADNQLPANQLELELTEGLVMTDAETSLRNLRNLKKLGVVLAVDDFGTGYSSLAYLKRLPIDILKIDKEFVGDITKDPDDEAITATIINMAHTLGLDVIAEGVETFEQIVYLEEKGCDQIQGHWLSTPISASDCLVLICRHDPADRPQFPSPA